MVGPGRMRISIDATVKESQMLNSFSKFLLKVAVKNSHSQWIRNLLRLGHALLTPVNPPPMKNQTKVMLGIRPVGIFFLLMPEGKRLYWLLVTQIS